MMTKPLRVTVLDENGSGTTFPVALLRDEVIAVMWLPEGTLKGANSAIILRHKKDAVAVAETTQEVERQLGW